MGRSSSRSRDKQNHLLVPLSFKVSALVRLSCPLPLARRFGRRPLLLCWILDNDGVHCSPSPRYTPFPPRGAASGKALVAFLCIYFGAYSSTIGPLSWVATGEMASNHLRSYTFGVAMTVGFFFAWLTTFTTPYFINTTALNWGAKGGYHHSSGLELTKSTTVAWIWAPSNLITVIFICQYDDISFRNSFTTASADFFLPETKGRGLEELDECVSLSAYA